MIRLEMRPRRFWTAIALILSGWTLVGAEGAAKVVHKPAYNSVADPSLPRLLIIGDSIAQGYTPEVRCLLNGKVNVHRPMANCGATFIGLRDLGKWLDGREWDLIHFNFGVHDLRYCFNGDRYRFKKPNGEYPTSKTGAPRTSLAEYEKNLRMLVTRLKATKAKLIWGSTTPIGEYFHGYDPVLVPKYNDVAKRVMTEMGVPINDLHAVIKADIAGLLGGDHVHPNRRGGQAALARAVVTAIRQRGD